MPLARAERRSRGENGNGYNATIVAETTSCGIKRNGKRLKKNSVLLGETESPAPFAHMDGSSGWNPRLVEDREGGDKETVQQNVDSRGDVKWEQKRGRLVSYKSRYSGETHCYQCGEIWEWLAMISVRLVAV